MDVSIGFSDYDEDYKRNMNDTSIEVFSNYGSWDDAFREFPHSPIYKACGRENPRFQPCG